MYYKKIKKEMKDEHVIVMEKYLGRKLEPGEIVHHIDNIKQHNVIENLELCLKSVHTQYHYRNGDLFRVDVWAKENLSKPNNHGTRTQYERYGCRCNLCKKVKKKHNAESRKNRRKKPLSIAPLLFWRI